MAKQAVSQNKSNQMFSLDFFVTFFIKKKSKFLKKIYAVVGVQI